MQSCIYFIHKTILCQKFPFPPASIQDAVSSLTKSVQVIRHSNHDKLLESQFKFQFSNQVKKTIRFFVKFEIYQRYRQKLTLEIMLQKSRSNSLEDEGERKAIWTFSNYIHFCIPLFQVRTASLTLPQISKRSSYG